LPLDTKPPLYWQWPILGRTPKPACHPGRMGEGGASPSGVLTGRRVVLISLLAHICLALAILRLDPLSSPGAGSDGFAVPVVAAGPAPQSLTAPQGKVPDNMLSPDKPARTQTELMPGSTGDGSSAASSAVGEADYSFRAFAVPVAAANASDPVSYQVLVGSLLERAKHYPESALRRGARGTAKIRFSIDKSCGVASVSVLRSSGQADLDLEGVALVRRASPFPPPPAGTKRSFAIEVAFGD
jgi:TonB family protein